MRYSKLLFATAQGMIKRVDGSEFQVSKRTIAATKLQGRRQLVGRVVTEHQNVVLQTKNGYFWRFYLRMFRRRKKQLSKMEELLQKKRMNKVYLLKEQRRRLLMEKRQFH